MCSAEGIERVPRTLVIGLGNPILGDDGVGWCVAEAVAHRLEADDPEGRQDASVEIDEMAVGGLRLMERLIGYQTVIVADAILDGTRPGTVRSRPLDEVSSRMTGHLDNAHDTTLAGALTAGRALGAQLPEAIWVVTVAIAAAHDFGDTLSAPVAAAAERAANEVLALLGRRAGVVA